MGADDDHIIKNEKRQSVLWRDSNYRSNTSTGCIWGLWQAHHILCNHSVEGRVIDKNPEYVEACLWITPWNLNASHNMIGLPINWQYRITLGKNPTNLPSHQVDHNTVGGYTKECTDWLKANVWDVLNDKSKDHKTNASNIDAILRAGSDYFRGELVKRGARRQGTAYCWDHRFPTPPPTATAAEQAGYEKEEQWYFPFSMAMDERVNERHAGVDWNKVAEALRKIG